MKYIGETFAYLKKSFCLIALVCLAPSVALGFFSKPLSLLTFVPVYSGSFVRGFGDVFRIILNADSLKRIYPPVIVFVLLLLSLCIGLSVIEKHFRIGKLTLKKPFAEINNTFFPVLKVMLLMTAVIALYALLTVSLVSLSHYIFCGIGKPNAGAVASASVISVLLFVLCAVFAGPMLLMMPITVIYGYSFADALTAAYELVGKKLASVVIGGIFPFAVVTVIQSVLLFFPIIRVAAVAISAAMYLFITVYMTAYIMVVMFDLSELARRDNKKYFG